MGYTRSFQNFPLLISGCPSAPSGLSDTFLLFYLKYVCALAAFNVNHPTFVPPSMLEDPSFGVGAKVRRSHHLLPHVGPPNV